MEIFLVLLAVAVLVAAFMWRRRRLDVGDTGDGERRWSRADSRPRDSRGDDPGGIGSGMGL
jgi:hypothetical protein